MKLGKLGVILAGVLLAGCAPQFIDIPTRKPIPLWVERDAIEMHTAIATNEQKEIVLSNVTKDQRLSPDERVVWVSNVDIKTSRLQRSAERIANDNAESNVKQIASQSAIVETNTFSIVGSQLSVKGQLALNAFKGKETSRYYVEFLNDGPMTEERVEQMMGAWKDLAASLKVRGLNTANVVMGGAKYDQSVNAIVLIKVGK